MTQACSADFAKDRTNPPLSVSKCLTRTKLIENLKLSFNEKNYTKAEKLALTLISKFPLPIDVDANIKLFIDLKNLDENLIAIVIDMNNNNETIIMYIKAKDILIPVLLSSTL